MIQSVAAVVVTYNRLDFLKEIIGALRNQTYHISEIIIINNSSSDGTLEWLSDQTGLTVITQPNSGSSGGQYSGIKKAFENGHEWIWAMDDDVVPFSNCLEELIQAPTEYKIRYPLRIKIENVPIEADILRYNYTNPFRNMYREIASNKHYSNNLIPSEGFTFEGPLFHRTVIEKTGLPDFGFFIYADDVDYALRAVKSGIKTVMVRDAKLQRKLDTEKDSGVLEWKYYYKIRNHLILDLRYGNFGVKLLRPPGYALKWLLMCRKYSDIITVLRAFFDSYSMVLFNKKR